MRLFGNLFGKIGKIFSFEHRFERELNRRIAAKLDVCQKNNENLARWRNATQESIGESISATVRQDVANKARYEYLNNTYAVSFASLFALFVIGTGANLRMRAKTRKGKKSPFNAFIQNVYWNWCRDAHLLTQLQVAMRSLCIDGEAFLRISYNPKRKVVPINVTCIEPQRIGNPNGIQSTKGMQDGIFFDEYGNVEKYCIYNVPEQLEMGYQPNEYEYVPAEQILHIQQPILPQQVRGLSWLAQSLKGMGQVRDYCNAVLKNAEICASLTAIFKTAIGYTVQENEINNDLLPGKREPWLSYETVSCPTGQIVHAPPGSDVTQLKPEQPINTYTDYKDSHTGEFGTSMNIPAGLAKGSHENYNYASGRLDGQMFELKNKVLQEGTFEEYVLDPFFRLWYGLGLPYFMEHYEGDISDIITLEEIENRRQNGLGLDEKNIDLFQWKWRSPTHVDPLKVSQSDALNLANGVETRENIIERNGGDADDYAEQIKKEMKMFPPLPGTQQAGAATTGANPNTRKPKDKGDDDDD
jgi:lambda family phage portal protein